VGAHLSRHNNTPELAYAALCRGISNAETQVLLACQQQGFDWIVLEA
jgi:hypothetical protein